LWASFQLINPTFEGKFAVQFEKSRKPNFGVDYQMRRLLYAFVLTVALVTVSRADIVLTFDSPDLTGQPGDTLQFFGVINNAGTDTVFFNADDINFSGAASLNVTDLFFANVPISLDGGQSSGDIELFDVSLTDPFTDSFGLYPGSYTLTGGVDGNAQDALASADFSVTAQEATGVPEPSAILLLVVFLSALGLGAALRIRRATGIGNSIR
jgi:hypothetical protein